MSRRFQAKRLSNWEELISTYNSVPDWKNGPFQTIRWIDSWARTLGREPNVQALPIAVFEDSSQHPILLLPLILTTENGLSKIEPADLGLTDYNAPILARNLALSARDALAIWSAIKAVLPPTDLILLTKIPHSIDNEPNPLCLLKRADKSPLNGNLLTAPNVWHDYHWGLERTFRKEIERSWRVFSKNENAGFSMIMDDREAAQILMSLEQQQAARMAELNADYSLDQPHIAAFYRDLVANGLAGRTIRLSALKAGDEVVAALLGITQGNTFAMVRLSTGDVRWRNCSPGRLIIYKTMEALHAEGFRRFDYTIGDYAYKRRMGTQIVPLCNIVEGLSLKGWPAAHKLRLRYRLQLSPLWRRLKGRKDTEPKREES